MARRSKRKQAERVIALAGNPNVGKSTVFNALTHSNQHTGNWAGKTVAYAQAYCRRSRALLVDLPGAYSLLAHSAEEEAARNFLCFEKPDAVIVVCDATCLERNLNLVLQTLEITRNVVVCVNLLDEAQRKKIHVDLPCLSRRLGVPVVGVVARRKRTLDALLDAVERRMEHPAAASPALLQYPPRLESALSVVEAHLPPQWKERVDPRWLSLRLLEGDAGLRETLRRDADGDALQDPALCAVVQRQQQILAQQGLGSDALTDCIVHTLVQKAEQIAREAVHPEGYCGLDRAIDRIVTSRRGGYPLMLALLAGILWLTVQGANVPSAWLSEGFALLQPQLSDGLLALHAPLWLHDMLVFGLYRVMSWALSVMLPPMAIFFPLFTLLEDVGYLPRIAYNLDRPFQRCHACGKQALTLCMGFGCHAVGVTGCRIIDSPRERILAVVTNSFVPCNGSFPTLVALLTIFFVGLEPRPETSLLSALLLTGVIVLGVGMTFLVTRILSGTVLRGMPSGFTLELPPYRRPQLGQVLFRSLCDRTLFVLGRAVLVAAPAGVLIWVLANVSVGELSLLRRCADFLDPFARCLGLDGVILLAFVLGFPANEIVVPLMAMMYLSQGTLTEVESLSQMRSLFLANGWTGCTALCTLLFTLFHWPCSTTVLTIYRETRSVKWTLLGFALPAAVGGLLCFVTASLLTPFAS